MAAAKGNQNAAGKHRAVDINDKKLAAEVRSLALTEIKNILEQPKMTQLKQQVILKLAGTVLPRLNEHSGGDGEPIQVKVMNYGNNLTLPVPAEGLPITGIIGS